MYSNEPITIKLIAQIVASGNPYRGNVPLWNRRDIADRLGRKKTTHLLNQIEAAVDAGLIHKLASNDGVRDCWVYTIQPPMF